jgi:hypothetical protein
MNREVLTQVHQQVIEDDDLGPAGPLDPAEHLHHVEGGCGDVGGAVDPRIDGNEIVAPVNLKTMPPRNPG